jgi:HEAT repeat protein
MRGAPQRRIAAAGGEDPGQAIRFAVVALCLLATACVYVGCILLVMGGHMEVLVGLLPWLAATAFGTILVVTLSALLDAGHERLRSRHRLTGERIRELAAEIQSLEPAQRAQAKKQLIERLDVTRDALAEILDEDPEVRGQLLTGGFATRVERELAGSQDKWHRVAAAGVLGLLGAETSVAALQRALDDRDVDVAYAAAQALSGYTSAVAYAALLFALAKQRLPAARIASLLEAFRCPNARELIERRAESANPQVRYWVAYLLGSLADPRSAPVIEQLTYDSEEDVRANAAESLTSFPDERHLRRLLDDESWVVRSHAAKAAGAANLVVLAPRLAELLEDRSWWVRQNAMLALAGFGDAAVPVLLAQLHSEDRFARNKAAEALIRTGYAGRQIEAVANDGPGREAAHAFLVDLGRAEALSTIENAARNHPEPAAQERFRRVLEEVERRTPKPVEIPALASV